MKAEEILIDLEQHDVAVTVDGEQLRIDAPRGALTEELRRTLSEHKPEIVELIRGRSSTPGAAYLEVATMKLTDFARAGLIVQVWSDVLDADVLFVSDNVPESKLKGRPEVVYRTHELKKLARVPPDPQHLRNVHMVKEILGGAIEDVMESDTEVGHAEEG